MGFLESQEQREKGKEMSKRGIPKFLQDERLLVLLLVGTLATSVVLRRIPKYSLSDAKTLFTLFVLLVLTKGLQKHRVLKNLAFRIERRRMLPVWFVLATFFFSALVTNDAALLTVIPLTLSLQIEGKEWLIILETLAANAGASLSPIGSPQNIFLYWHYNIPFWQFVQEIAPFSVFFLLAVVTGALWLSASASRVNVIMQTEKQSLTPTAHVYLAALGVFLLVILRVFPMWIGGVLVLGVLWIEKGSIRIDYGLLALFVVFFGLTDNLQALLSTMLAHPHHVFFLSSILSQGISNVPAALLLADFTPQWKALLWGVSVGGFGSLIASMANLIAYRLYQQEEGKSRGFLWKFHLASYGSFFAGWGLYWVYFHILR